MAGVQRDKRPKWVTSRSMRDTWEPWWRILIYPEWAISSSREVNACFQTSSSYSLQLLHDVSTKETHWLLLTVLSPCDSAGGGVEEKLYSNQEVKLLKGNVVCFMRAFVKRIALCTINFIPVEKSQKGVGSLTSKGLQLLLRLPFSPLCCTLWTNWRKS